MEPDEEYATLVLRPLDTPPPRPSTVDIGRAMAEGRRRRRIRRLTGVLAAGTTTAVVLVGVPVAAVALRHDRVPGTVAASPNGSAHPTGTPSIVAQPPPAPTACTIAKLPVPKGEMSLVTGGDPTGHYLVGRSYPDPSGSRPILIWHDDVVAHQVTVPGDDQVFYDVTGTGDAVGSSFVDGAFVAFAFIDGKLSRLSGTGAGARAINAHGTIVGQVAGQAVLWPSASATPVPLATPPGTWKGEAYGIDDDGTIVGTLYSGGVEHGVVWSPDGSVRPLPEPPVDGDAATGSRAFGLYAGWATGLVIRGSGKQSDPTSRSAPVRWNVRTGDVQVIGGLDGPTEGVNKYGWVVGSDSKGNAVLVSDTGVLTLPSLVMKVQPTDNIAYVVSDDGRTVAGQSVLDGEPGSVRAVVWHCH